ncbi:MAG: hypothetical protein AAF235_09785, partial [Planctomycetota bacterium]
MNPTTTPRGTASRTHALALLAGTLAATTAAFTTSTATAHDEDWRKLVDQLPPVYGPIYRIGTETKGLKSGDALAMASSVSAPAFSNNGVTLLSNIPLNNFAGSQSAGNDCWGYTSPSG